MASKFFPRVVIIAMRQESNLTKKTLKSSTLFAIKADQFGLKATVGSLVEEGHIQKLEEDVFKPN